MTAVANATFAAADWNTYVRDNFNTIAPAIAEYPAELLIRKTSSSGAVRSITTNGGWSHAAVAAKESTTSTSYTDLDTYGPEVTCISRTGWVYVVAYANVMTDITGTSGTQGSGISYQIMGTSTSIAASDDWATLTSQPVQGPTENNQNRSTSARLQAVTADEELTVTMKYRTTSGTGYYANRYLLVFPL